ncbi:hypothetical protein N0V90_007502 [Kalmusia sp. IMI 367209]|nr:hypothetical protein N0V90_007502 [Kalmusia sp. IMI 367209]
MATKGTSAKGCKWEYHLFRDMYDFFLATIALQTQATTGTAVVTTQFLEQVSIVSNHADRLHCELKPIVLAIESLLDLLSPTFQGLTEFRRLDMGLRAICKSLSTRTEDLVPRMETRLKFLEISRNIRESTSLWLLSLLAAIFLPLSLASSLLSMQTRIVELHFLLYDFCGVIVFFGSIAIVIILTMKQFAKSKGNAHGIIRVNDGATMVVIMLGWAAMFASFLVGMIVDVGLGLEILYLDAISTAGLFALFTLLRYIWGKYNRFRRFVRRWAEWF